MMKVRALLTALLLVALQATTQTAAAQSRTLALPRAAAAPSTTIPSEALSQAGRSHWVAGAVVGFVAGAGATALILHSGGSTAPCNRSANQDAMSSSECLGLTALGGLAGAAIGALVGSRIHSGSDQGSGQLRILPGRRGGLQLGLLVFRHGAQR